jgi:hypothetical protein
MEKRRKKTVPRRVPPGRSSPRKPPTRAAAPPTDKRVHPKAAAALADRKAAPEQPVRAPPHDTHAPEGLPDVLLDVPRLKVGELHLDVDQLRARVALHAELANLVKLDVGADVGVARVDIGIKGVEAQALLKVRLQNVYAIFDRALHALETHPELVRDLLKPVGTLAEQVGTAVHEVVEPEGPVGQVVEAALPPVERALEDVSRVTESVADKGSRSVRKVRRRAGLAARLARVGRRRGRDTRKPKGRRKS